MLFGLKKTKVTLHFSFLKVSLFNLNCSNVSIGVSEHNACKVVDVTNNPHASYLCTNPHASYLCTNSKVDRFEHAMPRTTYCPSKILPDILAPIFG